MAYGASRPVSKLERLSTASSAPAGASVPAALAGMRLHITGMVQGVGFRPFVYGLATRLALTGWVRNTSAGVDIEVTGSPEGFSRLCPRSPRRSPAAGAH